MTRRPPTSTAPSGRAQWLWVALAIGGGTGLGVVGFAVGRWAAVGAPFPETLILAYTSETLGELLPCG